MRTKAPDMVGPISPRDKGLAQCRFALEKMADMLEQAHAEKADGELAHCYFVMAKSFGMFVRDTGCTALHPNGPWAALSMVSSLMCDVDLDTDRGELASLVKLVDAARCVPVKERPRGMAPESKDFVEQLERIQARVLGMGCLDL